VHTATKKLKYIRRKFKGYKLYYCIKNRQQLQKEYVANTTGKGQYCKGSGQGGNEPLQKVHEGGYMPG